MKVYTTAGGKTEAEIKKSETLLSVSFSSQCKEFYEKYGYLSFFGNEIFGINPDDDSGILEGNSVAYADVLSRLWKSVIFQSVG